MANQELRMGAVERYRQSEQRATVQLMLKMHQHPNQLMENLRLCVKSILKQFYGVLMSSTVMQVPSFSPSHTTSMSSRCTTRTSPLRKPPPSLSHKRRAPAHTSWISSHSVSCPHVLRLRWVAYPLGLLVKHVPEWVPGARFKTQAKVWKAAIDKLRDVPYERTLRRLVSLSSRAIQWTTDG